MSTEVIMVTKFGRVITRDAESGSRVKLEPGDEVVSVKYKELGGDCGR